MYERQVSLKTSPFENIIDLHHVELIECTFIYDCYISQNTLIVNRDMFNMFTHNGNVFIYTIHWPLLVYP